MPLIELNKSTSSLRPFEYECWAEKVGGSIKTWKKRLFILKDNRLWYFEGKNDQCAKGYIDINIGTKVYDISGSKVAKKKSNALAIEPIEQKDHRVYVVIFYTQSDYTNIFTRLQKLIEPPKQESPRSVVLPTRNLPLYHPPVQLQQRDGFSPISVFGNVAQFAGNPHGISNCQELVQTIGWIVKDDDAMNYWKYWLESLPSKHSNPPLYPDTEVNYMLQISCNITHTKWEAYGSQRVMIKPIASYLYSVEAPDKEVEAIDNYGLLTKPKVIGNYINTTSSFGMDEGWFFPGLFELYVLKKMQSGPDMDKLLQWLNNSQITHAIQIGKEMVTDPSFRPSCFQFVLEGNTTTRVNRVVSLFTTFGLQEVPVEILDVLRNLGQLYTYLVISVSITQIGIQRVGIMIPDPTAEIVRSFLKSDSTYKQTALVHEEMLDNPDIAVKFVEYSYLREGFGRGKFTEGSEVMVHYFLGSELP
ncbi:hypothetical protein EIN_430410 [Entamoeba invadens IP1]|uniref:PH domain-containing protein n=1 Tax=Entamoeba invadens IP1 TaxID=370355 RepID=A0A0A1UF67_ENTIV|nr:hypothetical protein EIN_430410 [Entamoeba invadens IP1]ELP95235.1 hypothetical protein EIN_430410 [Entamoeba invadens IP1]|eukprot:XP_004262006.1 hypothetical protein EIN_430410 [Entamoeba invadens IP1]